jgi:hypothetical protein
VLHGGLVSEAPQGSSLQPPCLLPRPGADCPASRLWLAPHRLLRLDVFGAVFCRDSNTQQETEGWRHVSIGGEQRASHHTAVPVPRRRQFACRQHTPKGEWGRETKGKTAERQKGKGTLTWTLQDHEQHHPSREAHRAPRPRLVASPASALLSSWLLLATEMPR